MTIKEQVNLIRGFIKTHEQKLIDDYQEVKEEMNVPYELFVFTICENKELYEYTAKYYDNLKKEFDKLNDKAVQDNYDNITFLNYIMWTYQYFNISNRKN
jgi:CHASE3 domain sensor protein